MNVADSFSKCCGCGCCEHICPRKAIKMKYDDRGFLKPYVDFSKCIQCHLCVDNCDFNKNNDKPDPISYYALKANDDSVRKSSQSGGGFYLIAKSFLTKYDDGCVYGATLTNSRYVKHICVKDVANLNMLQKSKYAKSDLGDSFLSVANDLGSNRHVLFSGTPCQIASLKTFLSFKGIDTSNLITVDIVCHGTPPNRFWIEYVDYLEKKYGSKVIEARFRDKEYGWSSHFETFLFESKLKIKLKNYRDLFYSYHTLEEGCFECKYASYGRYSDLTLGDLWGNHPRLKTFKDNKGISLALVNTIKGKEAIESIYANCGVCLLEKSETKQPNLLAPSSKPKNYDSFWKYYVKKGFKKTITKYVYRNYRKKVSDFYKRVSNKIKRMLNTEK